MALWGDDGLVALGRAGVACAFPGAARVEQDPADWWSSLVAACAAARRQAPDAFAAVRVVGFSAARQTFVPVGSTGDPLGPAMVWSDRRAGEEAAAVSAACGGPDEVRRRTGVVPDAASVAAKIAWLAHHEPDRLRRARWLLAPRDLLVWRLTGEVCTDPTLASATGLYDTSSAADPGAGSGTGVGVVAGAVAHEAAEPVAGLVGDAIGLLPPIRPSSGVVGTLLPGAAGELGLRAGVDVVIGAGDRACEVLGAGASATRPMVSWGTTANLSVPVDDRCGLPEGMIVTRGALGGWLLEGGLSAAGSLVDWLARLTGLGPDALMEQAGQSPPGSRGVTVLPWFGGARAPWWRDSARGAVTGLSFDHGSGDLARAIVEAVAWDVARCLEAVTRGGSGGAGTGPVGLVLGGGGTTVAVWVDVLTAVTGLPASRRRSGEAASAGAALLAARATGIDADLDRLDPVSADAAPDPAAVVLYRSLRPIADDAARAVIGLKTDR